MNFSVLKKTNFLSLLIGIVSLCSMNLAYAAEEFVKAAQKEDLNEKLREVIVSKDEGITDAVHNHILEKFTYLAKNDQTGAALKCDKNFDDFLAGKQLDPNIKDRIYYAIKTAQEKISHNINELRDDLASGEVNFHDTLSSHIDPMVTKEIFVIRFLIQKKKIELLIQQGADVNFKKNMLGYTPMHWAVSCQQDASKPYFTKLLYSLGGDVNATDNDGCTPLYYAVLLSLEQVKVLGSLGGNLNAKGNNGKSPMQHVIDEKASKAFAIHPQLKYFNIVKALHEMGADLSEVKVKDEPFKRSSIRPSEKNISDQPTEEEAKCIKNFFEDTGLIQSRKLDRKELLSSLRNDKLATIATHLSLKKYLEEAQQNVLPLKNIALNYVRQGIKSKEISREKLNSLPTELLELLYIPADLQ